MRGRARGKFKRAIHLAAVLLPLASVAATAPAPSLGQLAERYRTPQAIARFLTQEFTYQTDETLFGTLEHWQRPEEFLARRAGDCEDYALLARELLRRNWIKAEALSMVKADGTGHTVCVFRDPHGRYQVIDEGRLYQLGAASLPEVATRLAPDWAQAGLVEPDGTRGRFVQRFD
jgi:predicted transglutaminase-like cysteine proteinase